MRALTCALLAVAALPACSDSKAKIDAAPTGDSGPHDGAPEDAPSCPPVAALPPCSTTIAGNRIALRELPRLPSGSAMLVTSPPNDPRLFVVEQSGLIYVYEDETRRPAPFLDISERIASGGEQGLLGLAFHPQYNCNGQFFVFYTTNNANVVARCSVSASDANVANPTCTPILSVPDFAGNHNGGMIEFGDDGLLYVGTGDGGGGGDPQRTAQDPNNLLGKMLRIDVDNPSSGKMYGIPADNPFATSGGAPEIFMLGLRNPWRWSFDRGTGDLWIGDVGQREIEELNAVPAGAQAGKNFGWSIYEGSQCCRTENLPAGQSNRCDQRAPQYTCDDSGLTMPQNERTHANGWISIIAGQTYRGSCHPDMVGWHYYTDYSGGARGLHRARLTATGFETQPVQLSSGNLPGNISSLHADARGELYMTTTATRQTPGRIYHLQAAP